MSKWLVALALVLVASGCSTSVAPRFASWEPVLEAIPVTGAAQAERRLSESYALWQKWLRVERPLRSNYGREWLPSAPAGSYSYVRARQLAHDRVAFTVFDVSGGRVELRAYLIVDPQLLKLEAVRATKRVARTLWVERGTAVGTHDEGAPARTIEQLYATCARSIATAEREGAAPPRLYFHPNGLLMQCGYPESECAGCEVAAIHDVSHFSLRHEGSDDVELWSCASEQGLTLPLGIGTRGGWACFPAFKRNPGYRSPDEEGVGDICQIDPKACAIAEPYRAVWSSALGFGGCSFPVPARAPRPLEVGKAEPLAEWAFPVLNGSPCGIDNPVRERPNRLRYVRQPDGTFAPIVTH